MSTFTATHEITFTPASGSARTFAVALVDGAAYTREEWEGESAADWERTDAGEWLCQGQVTPGGAVGTVTVRRATHAGGEITVEIGRHTIDPQGLGSDEDNAACEEHIIAALLVAFPGAPLVTDRGVSVIASRETPSQ